MDILFDFFISIGVANSLSKVLSFFIFETIYLSVLLTTGIFIFTFIRVKFLNDDLVRKLETKPKVVVYLGMALLGIISPFCSCSTIPVFVSFSALGVPTGALFVYLFVSPLVQETSIILLLAEFGIPVTLLYITFGVLSGIIIGILLSRAKDKDLFTSAVLEKRQTTQLAQEDCCGCCSEKTTSAPCCEKNAVVIDPSKNPIVFARREALQTLKSTYKYILVGIALGSIIHGLIPPSIIENLLGTSNGIAPIIATLIGIPIYADDVAMIPIAKTLIDSGAGLGTSLSFVMSSAVVSLPSFIMLASVLRKKTIIKLIVILITTIILIGYIFNWLQPYVIA